MWKLRVKLQEQLVKLFQGSYHQGFEESSRITCSVSVVLSKESRQVFVFPTKNMKKKQVSRKFRNVQNHSLPPLQCLTWTRFHFFCTPAVIELIFITAKSVTSCLSILGPSGFHVHLVDILGQFFKLRVSLRPSNCL